MNVSHFMLAGVVFAAASVAQAESGLPAFPGAEGFGRLASGGRGGDVYPVTQLGDDGPGSLREGIEKARGPRTIVFEVAGTIRLESELNLHRPDLTIAGQTAPGQGICVRDHAVVLSANNLVVRHLRSRLGTLGGEPEDAWSIVSGQDIMVDHCSASWSVDETLSASGRANRVTVQWCYITESLNESIHPKGRHGYGSLIRARASVEYTFHHNLFAHHASRNPRPGAYPGGRLLLDFRNNLIYDWGFKAGYSGGEGEYADLNYCGNYLVAGPSTTWLKSVFEGNGTDTRIYQVGNRFDTNRNGIPDGPDRGWEQFDGELTRVETPFPAPALAEDEAGLAYRRVLSQAGAMPWARDAVDARITAEVLTETGRIINDVEAAGGWPTLASMPAPADTDRDGMPDDWERALGHDPAQADHNGDHDQDGYTNLEGYLNWLGAPHARTLVDTPVEVDLAGLTSGFANAAYRVASGPGGEATLRAGGRQARWAPNPGFVGLASFELTAAGDNTEMTSTVQVLVTPQ